MQDFISQKQILEYLLAGGKIKHIEWKHGLYVFMAANGNTMYNDGTEFNFNFMNPRELGGWAKHKDKKRFWRWKINDGGWRVTQAYIAEDGLNTDGKIYGGKGWDKYEKEKLDENDFVEIGGCL